MSSEKKYNDEEIKAMVDDALRKAKEKLAAGLTPEDIIREDKELTPDELESAAGGRTLTTGEVITRELIEQYAAMFKARKMNSDVLKLVSKELGFYPMDEKNITQTNRDYDGAWVDQWATNQKGKVRQESEGNPSILDKWSTG